MIQFRVKMNGDHAITFERDRVGNIIIKLWDEKVASGPIATAIEKGGDISRMSAILCD